MIDLYTWTTPNGRKVSIALEELGLPYLVVPVDIGKDEQFKPEFLAKRGDDVKKIVAAWYEAIAFMQTNTADTRAILSPPAATEQVKCCGLEREAD